MYKLIDDGKYFLADEIEMILEIVSEEYNFDFSITEIYLHGSQLTDKEYPNDIDVYVQVSFNNNIKETQLLELLSQKVYEKNTEFKGTNIDLSLGLTDFKTHQNKLAGMDYKYRDLPFEEIKY